MMTDRCIMYVVHDSWEEPVFDLDNFVNNFNSLLRRDITIKILTDDIDERLINHIAQINETNKDNPMQFGYSNKLGEFNEFIMLSDTKYVLQVKCNQHNEIVASFSNEEHSVMIQEILFENVFRDHNVP